MFSTFIAFIYIYIGPISPQTLTFTLVYPVSSTSVLIGTLTLAITDDVIAEMDGIYNSTLGSSQDRLFFTDTTSEITVLDNESELCTYVPNKARCQFRHSTW